MVPRDDAGGELPSLKRTPRSPKLRRGEHRLDSVVGEPRDLETMVVEILLDGRLKANAGWSLGIDDPGTHVDVIVVEIFVHVLPDLPTMCREQLSPIPAHDAIPIRGLDLYDADKVIDLADEDVQAPPPLVCCRG